MPAQSAIEALVTALFARLRGAGGWSERVYLGIAPPDAEMPYVFFSIQSGGATNFRRAVDADFVVQVRAVDERISVALAAQRRLNNLLDDCGEQDNPADFVNGGDAWVITTITKGALVHITEQRPDNRQRTHAGDLYSIVMEQR